jgi:hypothetical protein
LAGAVMGLSGVELCQRQTSENTGKGKRVWLCSGDCVFTGAEQEDECQPY